MKVVWRSKLPADGAQSATTHSTTPTPVSRVPCLATGTAYTSHCLHTGYRYVYSLGRVKSRLLALLSHGRRIQNALSFCSLTCQRNKDKSGGRLFVSGSVFALIPPVLCRRKFGYRNGLSLYSKPALVSPNSFICEI